MTPAEHRRRARVGNYEADLPGGGRVKCRSKSERINLGLALLSRRAKGVPLTWDDMAAWCGCSEQALVAIFLKAMRKVRRALGVTERAEVGGFGALREGLAFFNEMGRAPAKGTARRMEL